MPLLVCSSVSIQARSLDFLSCALQFFFRKATHRRNGFRFSLINETQETDSWSCKGTVSVSSVCVRSILNYNTPQSRHDTVMENKAWGAFITCLQFSSRLQEELCGRKRLIPVRKRCRENMAMWLQLQSVSFGAPALIVLLSLPSCGSGVWLYICTSVSALIPGKWVQSKLRWRQARLPCLVVKGI